MSAYDQTTNGHDHSHEGHYREGEIGLCTTLGGYLTGSVLFIFPTVTPFWLVMTNVFDRPPTTAVTILFIGAVQIMIHMILSLYTNAKSEGGWNMLSLMFTSVSVVTTLSGSLWVMYHLNTNMMPYMRPVQTMPTILPA